jgi:ubiquinone/menaquinone biosynthesis C-methylase UbiE
MLYRLYSRLLINPSRVRLDAFAKAAGAAAAPGVRVLDAGAGDAPYRRHFAHTVYETADFCQLDRPYDRITYVCDLTAIPVEDRRFDMVFCSQVLEHVPRPQAVLCELARVLRPGGALWLSTPLFYEEHDAPFDFFRYTQYGLGHLLAEAGFDIVRMEWLEGYFATLSYQLDRAARALPLRPAAYGGGMRGGAALPAAFALKVIFAAAAIGFARLDLQHKLTTAGQCKNYAVVAARRAES